MDPFLEHYWNDVHGKLIAYIAEKLNTSLPARYRASMHERVVISDLESPATNARYPDVSILELPAAHSQGGSATVVHSSHLIVTSPELVEYPDDPLVKYLLEILDTKQREKVVTAIAVLSPENKRPGDGMTQFRRKQQEYRSARVNRVEIDLLREGRRMFEFAPAVLTLGKDKPYYITVHRGDRPLSAEIYAIDLRDRLPVIEVPLNPGEADVLLDVQPLLDRVYQNGRFPIDYALPYKPPLNAMDLDAARSVLVPSPR
jgi:hypothetical protein